MRRGIRESGMEKGSPLGGTTNPSHKWIIISFNDEAEDGVSKLFATVLRVIIRYIITN